MSNLDVLKQKIENIKPKKPVFRIRTRWNQDICFSSPSRDLYTDESAFYQQIIKDNICEKFDATTKRYKINTSDTFEKSVRRCRDVVRESIYRVCPAKRPRQTKFYKVFHRFMCSYKTESTELSETIVSLAKYYTENQNDMSSDSKMGKTYYGLLQALVKRYGG